MFSSGINLELLSHLTSKRSLGQHANNSMADCKFGLFSDQLAIGGLFQAASIAAVMIILLLIKLLAGQNNLISIDDDDIVTSISVRGVGGLVLAAQNIRYLAGNTAENLTLCVDDIPFTFDVVNLRHISLQRKLLLGKLNSWLLHDGRMHRQCT